MSEELTYQSCMNPKHKGLTYKCPRIEKGTICIICLGCELDAIDVGFESCSLHIHDKNGKLKKITQEEFDKLPEIDFDLYYYLNKTITELVKYRRFKDNLKEFLK